MLVQSSLLILILLFVDLLMRKKVRAGFRYWIWTLVLVKLILPTSLSTPVSLGRWFGEELAVVDVDQMFMPHSATEFAIDRHLPLATPMKPSIESSSPASKPAISPVVSMARLTWQGIVFLAWLVVVVIMALFLLQRTLLVRGLVAQAKKVDDFMNDTLAHCCYSMGIRRKVELRISMKTTSPAVCRLFRPVILLPQNLLPSLDVSQLRAILMHELAHLKRFDLWVNFGQTFLQIVYFYNPLLWLANAIIRRAREQAVDEAVLVVMGEKAQEYLETLINVAKLAFRGPTLSLRLIGVVESKNLFEWRIRTMLSRPIPKRAKLGIVGTGVLAVIAAIFLPMAKAQKPEPGNRPTTAHNTETTLVAAPIPIQPPTFRKIQDMGHYDAQLSPDGKSIALGYAGKLCIIPRDITVGSDDPNISHFVVNTDEIKVDPYGLAWSGNGRWIAFNGLQPVRDGERVGNYRMYVVSTQGGKPREVYDAYRGGYAHNRQMSLSPNGKTLAFCSVDANELYVYTIPVEGGFSKRLVEAPAREPVFSPDGKMIAYVEDKNLGQGGGGLWIVPANGGTPRQVAEASNACSPIWSPDGRMIAFFDWNNRDEQIWIVPINEDGERAGEKVTIDYPKETGGIYRLTGWPPDNKIGAIFKSPQECGLYTSPPNGEPATLVTHAEEGGFLQPRWSPDGKRIVYMKAPAEDGSNWMAWGLASIGAEGGRSTMTPIEPDTKMLKAGWGGGGSISPDGKTIVFAGCKAEEAESDILHVWTLPMEGGKPTQLTNAPAPQSDKFPCWSPDGKAIAFVRTRNSQNIIERFTEADIFILPAAGGEPRQLTAEPDMVAFGSIAWSPDGRLLAYFALNPEWPSPEETTIRVIPAEGGQSRVVAKLGKFDANMELAWSPDNRRIAFNAFAGRSINVVSLDDGSVVDVDVHMSSARIYHLDWSRDGEKLVFAGYRGGQMGFWLIENFLPVGMDMKESK